MDEIKHGPHGAAEYHHHHTHAADSQHVGSHHLLTVEHLTVSYRMYDPRARFWLPRRVHHSVLRDLTLSVHEGEILALVGASGSGKSVLADALMAVSYTHLDVYKRQPCSIRPISLSPVRP